MTTPTLKKRPIRWPRWLHWPPVVTYSVVFLLYLVASLVTLDPDFGWHLASGQHFLTEGIPSTDIFTYTAPAFPWVNHEWLSDCFVAIVYAIGGFPTLAVVFASLWTLAIWLVGRKALPGVVLLAAIATLPFAGVRALTWTVLVLALLIIILAARNHRWRWLIPALFLIWANIHGGVVIGLAYGGYVVLRERSWKLAAVGLVSAALTLVNPYGLGLYTEIVRTLGDGSLRGIITEWKSFFIPWMTLPFVTIWLAMLVITVRQTVWWRALLQVDVLLFALSIWSVRHAPLFALVAIGLMDERVKNVLRQISRALDAPRRRFIGVIAGGMIVVTLATIIGSYWSASFDRERIYPRESVVYLQQNPCSGALFNDYNYGGYLIWKLPSHRVFIDGRMPSWEHADTTYIREYRNILDNPSVQKRQFDQYNIQCVVIRKNIPIVERLQKEGWITVVSEYDSVLLVRQN